MSTSNVIHTETRPNSEAKWTDSSKLASRYNLARSKGRGGQEGGRARAIGFPAGDHGDDDDMVVPQYSIILIVSLLGQVPSWQKYLELRATGALDSGTTHPIWRRWLLSFLRMDHLCPHQLWRVQQPLGRCRSHGDFWLRHTSERWHCHWQDLQRQYFKGGSDPTSKQHTQIELLSAWLPRLLGIRWWLSPGDSWGKWTCPPWTRSP